MRRKIYHWCHCHSRLGQWHGVLEAAQAELELSEVSCLMMGRTVASRLNALSRFGAADEPRVLLLSAESHASGINLQCANHVVLLYPYCPLTQLAVASNLRANTIAYEQQAIARVRRFPQTRMVHVHRLVVLGSLEEEIYRSCYPAQPMEDPLDFPSEPMRTLSGQLEDEDSEPARALSGLSE